jgi:hypothetical protein
LPKTVDKKVFYYNIITTYDINNIFTCYLQDFNHDYTDLRNRKLIFNETQGEDYFLDIRNCKTIPPYNTEVYYECILYKLREKDFPYLFNLATGNINQIAADLDTTLMEQTHFIIFPDKNLLISEYNHNGARIEKLKWLLVDYFKIPPLQFDINPIFIPDNYLKLINADEIASFTFKGGHQGFETLSRYIGINLSEDLNNTYSELSDLTFEVTISGKPRKSIRFRNINNFTKGITDAVSHLRSKIHNGTIDNNDLKKVQTRMKSVQSGEKLVPLDLLEEKLVSEVKAIRLYDNNSKYINTEDLFKQLLDCFLLNRVNIDRLNDVRNQVAAGH